MMGNLQKGNAPRSIVIGTAGHIDHGKTTLVRALTGVDADRLPEEKRRGITIDLGFASMELQAPDNSSMSISFVDVPGHSDFIRNMLAGAGCVPAVMLVIAADEGIMPQTIEHLEICELLGISQGITAISKVDAVSAAYLQEVTHSIEKFLQGTVLGKRHSPIVHVSAATGEGLDSLRTELSKLASRIDAGNSGALTRLPLDRSFIVKGFGTVVTGTLLSGTIRKGETLRLEPGNRAVRVRGLQTHGREQEIAQPGSRVAVNLSGVDASEVFRGQTLLLPKTLAAAGAIDAEVRLLSNSPTLKHRASVHFHAFTSETMANLFLYGYESMQPGSTRLMRIRLAEPVVLLPGDRFVLRLPSPVGTIGGGQVLDSYPQPRLRKALALAWLKQLRTGTLEEQIALRVRRHAAEGIDLQSLSAEMGATAESIRRQIQPALARGEIVLIPEDLLVGREALRGSASKMMSHLQKSQRVKSSELRSRVALRQEIFDLVLNSLITEKRVRFHQESVSVYGSEESPTNCDAEQLAAIDEAYRRAGLAAPSVMELALSANLKDAEMRRIVTTLQRSKAIVRMGSDDLFIHSEALTQLAARISALRGSLIDVAGFKQLTGLSRKFAIPLLEYLDRQRITRKQGDHRLVL